MAIQNANHGKPVTRATPGTASLGCAGIDPVTGKSAFSADATAAIAPIMSEAVLACLRLFDPASVRKIGTA